MQEVLEKHKTAYVFGGVYHIDNPLLLIKSMAQALTAYAEERVMEALDKMAWGNLQKQARDKALEEAAKLVDRMLEFKIDKTSDTLHGPVVLSEIRALKDKK